MNAPKGKYNFSWSTTIHHVRDGSGILQTSTRAVKHICSVHSLGSSRFSGAEVIEEFHLVPLSSISGWKLSSESGEFSVSWDGDARDFVSARMMAQSFIFQVIHGGQ